MDQTTNQDFSRTLSLLRKEKRVSQRAAAEALGISQALLSHYENGIREPGLAFVIRACDYYRVSADYLLGRTLDRDGIITQPTPAHTSGRRRERSQAAEASRPIIRAIVLLFDLLAKLEDTALLRAAARYLSTAVYLLCRHLFQADPLNRGTLYRLSDDAFDAGFGEGALQLCQSRYTLALRDHIRQNRGMPPLNGEALSREYPSLYPSLLQIMEDADRQIAGQLPGEERGGRW